MNIEIKKKLTCALGEHFRRYTYALRFAELWST